MFGTRQQQDVFAKKLPYWRISKDESLLCLDKGTLETTMPSEERVDVPSNESSAFGSPQET
ncbi:hypothetical protein DPMN_056849 [Dreissena polymorpha]|uniref:Uncharacterized protein n=1 Tax=Dreissena polymorpha TaxID=45954 RepID=A0A9D4CVB5_DREPO|nr:hypothetical protein DPMN_056849 [Dreissena polymorpha]